MKNKNVLAVLLAALRGRGHRVLFLPDQRALLFVPPKVNVTEPAARDMIARLGFDVAVVTIENMVIDAASGKGKEGTSTAVDLGDFYEN